ncbi:MAG: hypothetical protein M3Y57_11995 [Acidobacteriota bacterium]|nr:hypothetical protein [Acidobacteriota bacterium]
MAALVFFPPESMILSFITLVVQVVFVGIALLPEWNEDPRFEGDKLGYRS